MLKKLLLKLLTTTGSQNKTYSATFSGNPPEDTPVDPPGDWLREFQEGFQRHMQGDAQGKLQESSQQNSQENSQKNSQENSREYSYKDIQASSSSTNLMNDQTNFQPTEQRRLSANLDENVQVFQKIFDHCSDVMYRSFMIKGEKPLRAVLIYIEGLIDIHIVNDNVLDPLMHPETPLVEKFFENGAGHGSGIGAEGQSVSTAGKERSHGLGKRPPYKPLMRQEKGSKNELPNESGNKRQNELEDRSSHESSRYVKNGLRKGSANGSGNGPGTAENVAQFLKDHVIGIAKVEVMDDFIKLADAITGAAGVLLIENSPQALLVSVAESEIRAISEPDTEPNVRGPKDGFVESLYVNLSLIRRRIKSSRLKIEIMEVGSISKTKVAICYLKGIANDKVVGEVKARIEKIKIDGILASGYLEEFISDVKFSIFPLVQSTERPDRVTASILEGRIGILVDNTPSTLIVPCTFVSLLQAAEDYYITAPFATFVRLLRFIGLNIALLLPAITVAAFSYHQELIPTPLLNTIAGARQELPFPIVMELIFIELTFELLREAGLRLPKTVGQAISTVGGLVIGEAAVRAGFVSPLSVVVVALTAIASFTSPNYPAGTTIRILRFFLLVMAGILGGVGIMLGLMIILIHLSALRSFGVPYLSPLAPLSPGDLKDTFIRVPWWAMVMRPRFFGSQEPQRQDAGQGPSKPDNQGGE